MPRLRRGERRLARSAWRADRASRGLGAPSRRAAPPPRGARAVRRRHPVRRVVARRAPHRRRRSRRAPNGRGRRCAPSRCDARPPCRARRRRAAAAAGTPRAAGRGPSRPRRAASRADGRAELRLGERHLALGLAHGVVGLHDERPSPAPRRRALRRVAAVRGARRVGATPRRRPPSATAAAPKTRREGNHQSPSGMCRSLGRARGCAASDTRVRHAVRMPPGSWQGHPRVTTLGTCGCS